MRQKKSWLHVIALRFDHSTFVINYDTLLSYYNRCVTLLLQMQFWDLFVHM